MILIYNFIFVIQVAMEDVIAEFEVDVNIRDVPRLYDYATCQYVTHKGENWPPLEHLGGTDHIEKTDENMMMQVLTFDQDCVLISIDGV